MMTHHIRLMLSRQKVLMPCNGTLKQNTYNINDFEFQKYMMHEILKIVHQHINILGWV